MLEFSEDLVLLSVCEFYYIKTCFVADSGYFEELTHEFCITCGAYLE